MKKRNLVIVFTTVVFLLVCAGGAFAGVKADSVDLTPYVGGYVFEGNQDLEDAFMFGAGLGWNITERFGMEFLASFVNSEDDIFNDDVNVSLFRLNSLYYFPMGEKLVPFVY